MSKLPKTLFETMKFFAKDNKWMKSETNGEEIIDMMDQSEYFGDDRDEDLVERIEGEGDLYHVRTEIEAYCRAFLNGSGSMRQSCRSTRSGLRRRITL